MQMLIFHGSDVTVSETRCKRHNHVKTPMKKNIFIGLLLGLWDFGEVEASVFGMLGIQSY